MQYIEYIQTDGYCWFDTGIIPSIDTKVEIVNLWPGVKAGDWPVYFGKSDTDWTDCTYTFKSNNNGDGFDSRFGDQSKDSYCSFTVDSNYNVVFDKNGITINNTLYAWASTPNLTPDSHTLWIAAENNDNTGGDWDRHRASIAKFGEIKVWENNVLIGDFKPVINDNQNIGFYDEVSQSFKANLGTGTPVAGPVSSSIVATASKTSLAAAGETINIEVTCENAWTATQTGEWLTLSSAGDTGGTTITATAPSYSGTTARETTITFTDSVTGDEAVITIKQKKYTSGQPVYLGGNEVSELYLGSVAISEAYLGENLVYSSGPFQGLKVSPSSISFNGGSLSKTLKVKASESWTMSVPEWITASSLTGDTGTTEITLTTTEQEADTAGTISVVSENYSASSSVEYIIGTPRLIIDNAAGFMTSFSPYAAYTGNSNYLKYEINVVWTGSRNSGAYIFATGESTPFFSCERFSVSDKPYCNLGNSSVSTGPENGADYEHSWIVEVNNGTANTYIDGTQTETKTISGSWPEGNLSFANYNANNLHCYFYSVKFWGANDTLLASFVPASDGSMYEEVSQTTISATGTGTSTFDLLIL